MAIKYHPDNKSGDKEAEENFKEAAEAYEYSDDNAAPDMHQCKRRQPAKAAVGLEKLHDNSAGANEHGLIKDDEEISINIPAGARDGIQLSVRGKGNDAPFGGTPGDLLVVIEEEED
ncbi:hypothetical protein FQR65_LT19567 [Abscondita terminalis]|nr:hypothetical protein FQR65_LT19567 [Abscondita terminalis]